jgi:hypothetical protein
MLTGTRSLEVLPTRECLTLLADANVARVILPEHALPAVVPVTKRGSVSTLLFRRCRFSLIAATSWSALRYPPPSESSSSPSSTPPTWKAPAVDASTYDEPKPSPLQRSAMPSALERLNPARVEPTPLTCTRRVLQASVIPLRACDRSIAAPRRRPHQRCKPALTAS